MTLQHKSFQHITLLGRVWVVVSTFITAVNVATGRLTAVICYKHKFQHNGALMCKSQCIAEVGLNQADVSNILYLDGQFNLL